VGLTSDGVEDMYLGKDHYDQVAGNYKFKDNDVTLPTDAIKANQFVSMTYVSSTLNL
jgi:hypothetical protein